MRISYTKDPNMKGVPKDIANQPVVIKVGDITEASAKEFSVSMTEAYNTGQEVIPIIIDSFGGCVYALLSILSDIESSRLPVATICKGKAMSAGAVLLAHGTPGLRFGDPNATVMIHEVSSFGWGKLTELRASMEEVDRLNYIILAKMAAACGHKDLAYFPKLMEKKKNADWYMDIFEAKKHKIIDNIGVPEFHVELKEEIKFIFEKPELVDVNKKIKDN